MSKSKIKNIVSEIVNKMYKLEVSTSHQTQAELSLGRKEYFSYIEILKHQALLTCSRCAPAPALTDSNWELAYKYFHSSVLPEHILLLFLIIYHLKNNLSFLIRDRDHINGTSDIGMRHGFSTASCHGCCIG